MLVNQMALARTFKGVCSDLDELYHNGTNLVNSSDVHYMGYSLGGIYGASITAFSPDIDRAALWVGGSGFSSIIERSTNYATFSDGFILPQAYPERNDRALLIGICHRRRRRQPTTALATTAAARRPRGTRRRRRRAAASRGRRACPNSHL